MRLGHLRSSISRLPPIQIYHSQASCWHTLKESDNLLGRRRIQCLLCDLAKTILSALLFATLIWIITLLVVFHSIPNNFNRVSIRQVERLEVQWNEPLAYFLHRPCGDMSSSTVLHCGAPRSYRDHAIDKTINFLAIFWRVNKLSLLPSK